MDNVEKLKGMIVETVNGGMEAIKDEVAKQTEELTKLKEDVAAVSNDITAIKELPATNVTLGAPGRQVNMIHNGISLVNQGRQIQNDAWRLVNDESKQGIAKMLIDACTAGLKGQREYKINTTLVEGTPGSGGYLVFDEFMNIIRTLGELTGVMLAEAEVVPMNSDVLHYPVDNDKSITVLEKSETADFADGVPANMFTEVELTATRLGAYAVLTNQLMDDSTFDIVSFLMPKFATAVSRKIDSEVFTTGGSGIFDPLVDDANILDSTGTLDIVHLLDAFSKLDSRMSAGAKYFFHRLVHFGTVLAQTDTAGNAIFPPTLTNMGKKLWDIPVVLAEDLPYTLTDGLTVGLCGNMKQAYIIGMRKGVGSFFFNPYSLDISEQTRITLGTRWDGKVGYGKSMVKLIY